MASIFNSFLPSLRPLQIPGGMKGIMVKSASVQCPQASPSQSLLKFCRPCTARIGVINVACRPKPSAAFSSVQQPLLLEKQWKNLPASFLVTTALFPFIYLYLKFEFLKINFIFKESSCDEMFFF